MSVFTIMALLAKQAAQTGYLTSLANCHFPGLYSIVLDDLGTGCLLRAYIAPPGGLHPWLTDPLSPFLWHAHAYDFRSTTVAGRVRNEVLSWGDGEPSFATFDVYEHVLGSTQAGRSVSHTGEARRAFVSRVDYCGPTESYSLAAHEIHRVTFWPCPVTGWFVALIRETCRAERPASAWSTQVLTSLPGADELYRPMPAPEVIDFCDRMVVALEGVA